ncbi:MAG TPA: hypothetical protein VMA32_11060 [Streptosporangiaceae bacterium]|nr:hypothetical protein [Streptosporangiaceae bacterium]
MIRRGFWLAAGAVLGITGYRKATRLARTLTGQGQQARSAAVLPTAARASIVARQTRLALPARASARPGSRAASAVAGAAAAAGFVRDVRDGMAEYWDLHRGELDRTLGSRSDRSSSGDSPQGHREP